MSFMLVDFYFADTLIMLDHSHPAVHFQRVEMKSRMIMANRKELKEKLLLFFLFQLLLSETSKSDYPHEVDRGISTTENSGL